MRFGSLPRPARAYIVGVLGLAVTLVIVGVQLPGTLTSLGGNPAQAASDSVWWIFAALVLAASVAHIFPVSSVEHRQAYHVSLPFFVSSVVLLPPLPLAALMVVVHLAEWVRRPQRSWFAQAFNLAVYILSAGLAQAVYLTLWPRSNSTQIDLTAP